jgi:putative transposase
VTPITDDQLPSDDHHEMNLDRTFFVTTATAARLPIFRRDATANLLIETLARYRDEGKYLLHEFVIMPDHIHLLLTPSEEISLERAVQFIKGGFSFRLRRGHVWQQSFTDHRVRDVKDYERHREYIRLNPVQACLSVTPESYPYSSAAARIRMDNLPQGLKPYSNEDALTRR